MIYLHQDQYGNDSWYKPISEILNDRGIGYTLVDLLSQGEIKRLAPNKSDLLIARFGHIAEDLRRIRPLYDDIHQSFSGRVFPNRQTYFHYDRKDREYLLMRQHNVPVIPSRILLSSDALGPVEYPVVAKKFQGAGAEFVYVIERDRDWRDSMFPCLIQPLISTDCDYRITLFGDYIAIHKRNHAKSTIVKKYNFPYGTSWQKVDVDQVDHLYFLGIPFLSKLFDFRDNVLDTPVIAYDVIFDRRGNPRVLEFSYCFPFDSARFSYVFFEYPSMKQYRVSDYNYRHLIMEELVRKLLIEFDDPGQYKMRDALVKV